MTSGPGYGEQPGRHPSDDARRDDARPAEPAEPLVRREPTGWATPEPPTSEPAYGPPPAAYGQPMAYGQPPAAYGQPPAAYGQPTAYGQPAAAYGQPAAPYGQPPGYGSPPAYSQHDGYGPPQRSTNGLAIASLVLGLVWVYWIGSVLALVFGYVALRQIEERGQEGRGLAIAGIVLGWIGVGVVALAVVLGVAGAFSTSTAP